LFPFPALKLEELHVGVSAVLLVCTFLPGGILYLEQNSSPSTRKEEWSAGRGCGGGWSRMVELASAWNKGCGEGGGGVVAQALERGEGGGWRSGGPLLV